MAQLACADTGGRSTNAYRVFQRLREQRMRVDRVILLSDMQCWNDRVCSGRQFASEFLRYRDVVNPDAWLHSVDLVGHGDSTVPADVGRLNLVSGFSEKVLTYALLAEHQVGAEAGLELPTIEFIRANF